MVNVVLMHWWGDSLIFSVGENLKELQRIDAGNFANLSIWERKNIQEWVRANPQILGEELLIVSMEFDRFVNSADRLDLLALDRDGNLVVIELKRDSLAGFADLQAIRYAAMVSSMTLEKLAPYYVAYQSHHCNRQLTTTDAVAEMKKFVDVEQFAELSSKPRIILCSEGFSQEITTTVLWLRNAPIDISCVQITPYKHKGSIVIVPKVLIPLIEAKQYLIDIKSKEVGIEASGQARKRNAMKIILENGLMKAGDPIYLKSYLPSWLKYNKDDPTYHATITGKTGQSNTVQWKKDGKEYSISNMTWRIFTDLHPEEKEYGGLSGAWHWVDSNERPLYQIANDYLAQD
jgi:hypothetical protein